MVFLRRGYGAFVQCGSEVKARQKAAHWHRTGQGDQGRCHPVISLFVAASHEHVVKGMQKKMEVLYGKEFLAEESRNRPTLQRRIDGGVLMPGSLSD